MTFKDFYIKAKPTIKFYYKIFTIGFTVIFTLIYIATTIKSGDPENPIIITIGIFGLGQLFGIFFLAIGLYVEYKSVKSLYDFFNEIPKSIRETLDLCFIDRYPEKEYEFIEYYISGTKNESYISFTLLPENKIMIRLLIDFDQLEWIDSISKRFNKKYSSISVSINGIFLARTIKRKRWKRMDESEILKIVANLYEIAETEKIKLKDYSLNRRLSDSE
jgi:hypothetical protein